MRPSAPFGRGRPPAPAPEGPAAAGPPPALLLELAALLEDWENAGVAANKITVTMVMSCFIFKFLFN